MYRIAALFLVTAAAALGAAAQDQPLPNPIAHPGAAWGFEGFTLNAPDAPGWVSHFKDKASAALALENPQDELGVTVLSDTLDPAAASVEDLVRRLEASRPTLVDLERYEVVEREERAEALDVYWCSRYWLKARDRGSAPAKPARFLLMRGLTCVDPRKPALMADVGYSEIGPREQMEQAFVALGEKVVRSLRFSFSPNSEQIAKAGQAYRNRKTAEAVALLTPLAEANDLLAAAMLGDFLMNPADGPANQTEARRWLALAAPDGNPQTLYNLGVLYDKGAGVERNVAEAVRWFSLAADQRDATAQLNLGILYHPKGPAGVEKDVQVARRWLTYAANNGNQRARRLLMQEQMQPQP
jgi:TPR repeat protein